MKINLLNKLTTMSAIVMIIGLILFVFFITVNRDQIFINEQSLPLTCYVFETEDNIVGTIVANTGHTNANNTRWFGSYNQTLFLVKGKDNLYEIKSLNGYNIRECNDD